MDKKYIENMLKVRNDNRHQIKFYKCLKEACMKMMDKESGIELGTLSEFKLYIEDENYVKHLANIASRCTNMIKENVNEIVILDYAFTEIKPYDEKIKGYIVEEDAKWMYEQICQQIDGRINELQLLEEIAEEHEVGKEFVLDTIAYFEETRGRKIESLEEDEDEFVEMIFEF